MHSNLFVKKSCGKFVEFIIPVPQHSHQIIFVFSPIPIPLSNYSRPLSLSWSSLSKA